MDRSRSQFSPIRTDTSTRSTRRGYRGRSAARQRRCPRHRDRRITFRFHWTPVEHRFFLGGNARTGTYTRATPPTSKLKEAMGVPAQVVRILISEPKRPPGVPPGARGIPLNPPESPWRRPLGVPWRCPLAKKFLQRNVRRKSKQMSGPVHWLMEFNSHSSMPCVHSLRKE